MLDLIASFLVRGLNRFLHVMPIGFNLWLGRCLGDLVRLLSGKRIGITYANLKAAFCREKTPKEIKHISKGVYRHMAQTFAELVSLTKVDEKYVDKYIKIQNMERIEKASKNPKGMIMVSAHFGNWELSTAASAIKGYTLCILAREQKMKRLNELFNQLRESKGATVIRKGMDIKRMFRLLREGRSVGLLADQNAGTSGKLIDFFGRPASTAIGPYRFAQKSGAWVLPAFIHRVKGPYQELILEEPMVVGKDEDVTLYARRYNKLLEKHIRAYPEQWFWMHKRWKLTPVKKIMVLDDGKKGHLKQSLAVVKQIEMYRRDEGFRQGEVEVDILRVQFKSKRAKAVFNAISPFFTRRCQGCLKCLKRALSNESYEVLSSRYGDVIISCGSTLFGVNKMIKIENNARNVTVLDPGWGNRRSFDLVVMPKHDQRGKVRDNVIVTELAPNLIDPEGLKAHIEAPTLAEATVGGSDDKRKCIGLLFGGDNPHFSFGEDLAKVVADGIRDACVGIEGGFYVTTSRRTPKEIEAILKENIENKEVKGKFVSGVQDKDKNTVEKILAKSDVVVVSGESISMVSEAVSSGKPTLVFMPEKKTRKVTKYERFVNDLAKNGYVKCIEAGEIRKETIRAIEDKNETVLPDDDKRMYERMYRLF